MMKILQHLTKDQLVGLLRDSEPDMGWLEHLRTCPDCRGELALSVLIGGLMRSKGSADGADHLPSTRIREAHAAAFEFDELKPTQFIAALRHMNRCDRCYARFFALHESHTPSNRAVSGAIERFSQGQSRRRAGTLRIIRSLERLAQAFEPIIRPAGSVGLRSRRIPVANLLTPGRPDDVPLVLARSPLAMSDSSAWIADEIDPVMRKLSRESPRVFFRESSPDDGWDKLDSRAQTAAQSLEEAAGQVQNLRNQARTAEQEGDEEKLELTLDELNRLQERFASVTAPLKEIREQSQQVVKELRGRLVEVRRRNQKLYETEPEKIVLPSLELLVVSKWRGRSGDLEISAVDPETHEPRPDVEITPVVTKGTPLPSIRTDARGRAVVPLKQQLVGLEIVVDPTEKPWVIDIAISSHPLPL